MTALAQFQHEWISTYGDSKPWVCSDHLYMAEVSWQVVQNAFPRTSSFAI